LPQTQKLFQESGLAPKPICFISGWVVGVLRGGGVSGGGVVVVVVRCVVWCVLGVPWVCGGCVVCEVSGGGVAGFIVVGGGGRRRRRGRGDFDGGSGGSL
jgi:hypothetical protein